MSRAPALNWRFRKFARPGRQKSGPRALAVEPRQGAVPGAQDHPYDGRPDGACGLVANHVQSSPGKGPYPAAKIITDGLGVGGLVVGCG
jgi:hypothetical protein